MPREQFTGLGRLFWVPDPTGAGTAVTMSGPKASEINAGVEVTHMLKRDGLDRPQSGNVMDTSDAASRQNSTGLGTYGGDKITLKFYRDTVTNKDIAWPLFSKGQRGFLVALPFGTAGAQPAAGDRAEVYQSAVNTRAMDAIAENQAQTFSVELTQEFGDDDVTLVA